MMNKLFGHFIAVLSVVPPMALVLVALSEPLFYTAGWDRQLVSEIADGIRWASTLLVVAMLLYFASYIKKLAEPGLARKKGLWITILFLGNVFAVPIVWYLFVFQRRPLH